MMDYKHLEALSAVIEEEGFEKAAARLFITQSAVSQRIKQLEEDQGQILLSRENPPQPTERGERLIKLYKQVQALEENLSEKRDSGLLTIGINADSLATWFLPAIREIAVEGDFHFEVKIDDQEKTAEMLKKGTVAGCISSSPKAIQGCRSAYMGSMDYYLVSTENFRAEWFSSGLKETAFNNAPAVIYNKQDRLHDRYLKDVLGLAVNNYPRSYIPSSESFVEYIAMGAAYGVVPKLQFPQMLSKGDICHLHKGKITVPLYWHYWNIDTPRLNKLTESLISYGKGNLV